LIRHISRDKIAAEDKVAVMTSELFGADAAFPACNPAGPAYLPELPPFRWRSLGKRLDYTDWEDRDRFMELDAAILASRDVDLHRNESSRSAEPQTDQSSWTENHAHVFDSPERLDILLNQLASAVSELRPAA